ncbi:hypothetical protein ACIQ9P_04645 [Kitasatospora sp. NPDC094019]|uniref:hypothetical protein n=1 Tax=Kitasatospora sp. NPDC094019 TaxID=3364091 RepID=UPI00382CAAF9
MRIRIALAAAVLVGTATACSSTSGTGTGAASPSVLPTVTRTVVETVTAPAAPAPTVTVTSTATVTAIVTPEPTGEAAAKPDGTIAGSGTYLVGTDVQPGTYKTAGPSDSTGLCYWERSSGTSGDAGSIIANDALTGQGVVTIKKSDALFKSQGCQKWTKVG